MDIKRVAVLGSGVMGAGIAAHITNAGIPVVLLDIVPKNLAEGEDRSKIAKGAVEKLLKADPAAFMSPKNAKLITPGNLEDDLNLLADCDWIVEVVLEDLAIKRALYDKIDPIRKVGSIVSSNTSTIPLALLAEQQSDAFKADFLITHFFNPPRYMRLLELVKGKHTRADAVDAIRRFGDEKLGKAVVDCHDRPGFIGNRLGVYWLQVAVTDAMDMGLTVEEADAIVGKPMGIPKTGVFGLIDLIGIDLMPHIAKSLLATLPEGDAYRAAYRDEPLITKMIADGYTGRKGKGGFYRINKAGGGKVKESLNLKTGDYAPSVKANLESAGAKGVAKLVAHTDKGGVYAWSVLSKTLSYAASLVPEIADDIFSVDEAMRTGYGWKAGPFEMIDAIGASAFAARLKAEGRPVPDFLALVGDRTFYKVEDGKLLQFMPNGTYQPVKRPDGVLLLSDVKRGSKPVAKNGSASLWDVGDGVLCLEFTSKMNALDESIFAMLSKAIALIGDGKGQWKGLVIHNEGSNFSVGANIGIALFALNIGLYPQVESMIAAGQAAYKAMKYAPFPVVAAPAGMALGGGCECLLHTDAVVAHAESYIGLVEVGVGVIPGWGGCKEMLTRAATAPNRAGGPMPPIAQVFEAVGTAKVSKSAEEAKSIGYLRPTDSITMNKDRLLADAKAKVLELSKDYQPPKPVAIRLPGESAKLILNSTVEGFAKSGKATPHDVTVSDALAYVLSGGDTDITVEISEDRLLELEREQFMRLCRTNATLDRIEHMLSTGKPLRN